ncbi:hypothetical protein ACIQU4_40160 [Streptomyces sp. NPDC090741]|uniref:hypothetical protein n=1 Tax=Streptomyces sp. NPDC090741 TaxID=3365967 RepID=UPI00380E0DBB
MGSLQTVSIPPSDTFSPTLYGQAWTPALNELRIHAASPDLPGARTLGATVFTSPDFSGQFQNLTVGRYDIGDLTIPNDSVSAVVVFPGMRVTLYEHAGFEGTATVLEADTESLADDIDSTASSIVVEWIKTA